MLPGLRDPQDLRNGHQIAGRGRLGLRLSDQVIHRLRAKSRKFRQVIKERSVRLRRAPPEIEEPTVVIKLTLLPYLPFPSLNHLTILPNEGDPNIGTLRYLSAFAQSQHAQGTHSHLLDLHRIRVY